jgi:ABC-2 type transport system permease protein
MMKLYRVFAHEFGYLVRKKSFIINILSLPLLLGILVAVLLVVNANASDHRPIGLVDSTGAPFLTGDGSLIRKIPGLNIDIIPFKDEIDARKALKEKRIQGYVHIPAGFEKELHVQLVYNGPGAGAKRLNRQIRSLIRKKILSRYPVEISRVLSGGNRLIIRSPDGSRELLADPTINQVFPLVISLSFVLLIFLSSGYLMQTVAREKENRTVEILLTSMSARQLMGGKILAIVSVGLLIFLSWLACLGMIIAIAGGYLEIQWFQAFQPDPGTYLSLTLFMLPTYVLITSSMAAVGATILEQKEGLPVTILFSALLVVPLYFVNSLMTAPEGILSIILNLVPFTALLTFGFRNIFIQVPWWQVAMAAFLLVLTAALAWRFAARAFQQKILNYRQSFSWRHLFRIVKDSK